MTPEAVPRPSVAPSSRYSVRSGAAGSEADLRAPDPPRNGTAAVIVVHGIGGQLPFQTLTETADGLRDASRRLNGTPSAIVAKAVGVGDDRLQRMELTLSNGAATREVHVYEAYWAPITEGQITLRDVIRFLFKSGFDGLRHSVSGLPFKRFLNQRYVEFPVPVRTPLFLLTALLVTLSLVVMNASIVSLAALRTPLSVVPDWVVSPSLFRDVTAVLDLFVAAALVFGVTLGAALWRARGGSLVAGLASVAGFVLLLTATVACGVALPLVIYFHTSRARKEQPGGSILDLALGASTVDGWLHAVSAVLMALTAIALVIAVAVTAKRVVDGLVGMRAVHGSGRQLRLTLAVVVATLVVLGGGLVTGLKLLPQVTTSLFAVSGSAGVSLVWLLAIGVSALGRRFLVAYVGDVAAYIQPQELDRFNTLRERVKDCVWATARAVYRSPEQYDEIVMAGHSLGSVIGYDTLNRLYREEELGTVPRVRERSRLFVTFGSPLDKTAFLFAIQGSNREGREALAASVQPLIGLPATRPRWVNVYSDWDIISGSLDFYDSPHGPNPVDNQADPAACVWLAAHNQYWHGALVFDTIHRHLVR